MTHPKYADCQMDYGRYLSGVGRTTESEQVVKLTGAACCLADNPLFRFTRTRWTYGSTSSARRTCKWPSCTRKSECSSGMILTRLTPYPLVRHCTVYIFQI